MDPPRSPGGHDPNYRAELDALHRGMLPARAAVGSTVRITVPGEFHGRAGRVVKVGRTGYHVRLREGVLRVLFAGAEQPHDPQRPWP